MWVILQRELLVRGRAWGTWAMRLLVTLAALALVGIYSLLTSFEPGARAQSGEILFGLLFYGLMLFCLFEGIRTAALGITEERQEGTLGLLFLTPLNSLDVLLGKLSGAAITAFCGLLSVAPLLSLPLLLGGVTLGEVFRAAVVLTGTLALSLACGLVGSVRSRDGIVAIVKATAWLIALLLLPLLGEFLLQALVWDDFSSTLSAVGATSPIYALMLASSSGYASSPDSFWWGQAGSAFLTLGLVLLAGQKLRGSWRNETEEVRSAASNAKTAKIPVRPRSETAVNALGTVVARRARSRRWFWSVIGLSAFAQLPQLSGGSVLLGSLMMLAYLPAVLASMAASLVLIYVACRTYAEARQTGEMEILLTTPVEDREIVRTLWLALRPFVVWLTVLELVAGAVGFSMAWAMRDANEFQGYLLATSLANLLVGPITTVLFTSACLWVGMWHGLTARKVGGAVAKTFLLVVVATSIGVWLVTIPLQFVVSFQSFYSASGDGTGEWPFILQMLLRTVVFSLPGLLAYWVWQFWARKQLYARFRIEASRTDTQPAVWSLPRPEPPPLPEGLARPPHG